VSLGHLPDQMKAKACKMVLHKGAGL
jgi:hypothetical protein